jgi:hypothetical protein
MSLVPEVRLESVAGIVMDLTARTLWIAPDVPSKVEFEEVAFAVPLPVD